jgi:alpha-1,3/alpha-1,6-mannosyltransferase
MKVADMFGAGLPVCAFDYGPCLRERLIDGSNGLLHKGSRQLAEQLQRLFSEFPEKSLELEQLRHGLSLGDGKSWADGWREEAAALLLGEAEKSPHSSPEKSLHVAFFHPNLGIGGAERWLVDAALSLQDAGHRVTIITSHHNPKHCYEETVNGALTVRVRGSFLPAHIGKRLRLPCVATQTVTAILSTALRREHFDLTFVDLVPHVIPLLRRLGHRNIVYYCHYPDQLMAGRGSAAYQLYRRPINRLEASAVARADRVLVNSHFTADAVRTIFAHLPDRAPEVLHPGVRLPERQAVGAEDSGERMLLSINRFDRKKRIDLAIEAFAALAVHLDTPAIRRTRLVIAGSYNPASPESDLALRELELLAKELGVSDRVTFLKSPSDTLRAELLSRCHCLIYTPVAEHFGLVPLEAMAAGRPVIAVRHGGPLETIRDLETGLLCEPNSDAFAEAIARLLSNPAEAQRMGQAGRDWVARRFSLESFANRLTEIVEELANKESTR